MKTTTKALLTTIALVMQLSLFSATIDFTCTVDQTFGNTNITKFTATISGVAGGTAPYTYCFQWEPTDSCGNPTRPQNWDKKTYNIEGSFDVNGFVKDSSVPAEIKKKYCGTVFVRAGVPLIKNIIKITEMNAVPRNIKFDQNILFSSTVKNVYDSEIEAKINFYLSDEAGNNVAGAPDFNFGPQKIKAGKSFAFDFNYLVKAPLEKGKNYFINSRADANYIELPEYQRDNERRTIFSVLPDERTTKGLPETNLTAIVLTIAAITFILRRRN